MRRLGIGGFNSLKFGGFQALGYALKLDLLFANGLLQFDNDLVEFIKLVLEVGEVRFEFLQAFLKSFVTHAIPSSFFGG